MKHLVLILLSVCGFSYGAFSQSFQPLDEESSWKDRIYVNGGLGMQFGTYTYIDVSPNVGYMITSRFSAGVGGTFRYIKRNDDFYNYETNAYGYRVFANHTIGNQFFLQGEVENLNFERYYTVNESKREWVTGVFFGGGIFQPIGRRSGFFASALYNFTYDELRSPYGSPLILRVGVSAGF